MFYVLVTWIKPLPSDIGRHFLVSSLKWPTRSVMLRSPKSAHHRTLAFDASDDTASVALVLRQLLGVDVIRWRRLILR